MPVTGLVKKVLAPVVVIDLLKVAVLVPEPTAPSVKLSTYVPSGIKLFASVVKLGSNAIILYKAIVSIVDTVQVSAFQCRRS